MAVGVVVLQLWGAALSTVSAATCGCFGCDPSRHFDLGPDVAAIGSWNGSTTGNVRLLWAARPVTSESPCVARCVGSGEGTALCGYSGCGQQRTTPARDGPQRLQPAVVSYDARSGQLVFNSTELPSADTTPLVAQDVTALVVTKSESAGAMAAIGVDGVFVGAPIPAPLAGAGPPAVTANGVVMWLLNSGALAGYLTNGVPHASMPVPTPVSVLAIGDDDLNSVFFVSTVAGASPPQCVVTRVDVARTMNSRFVTVWQRKVQCPPMAPVVDGSRGLSPLAVAGDVVILLGPAAQGCGAQMLSTSNGTALGCIPTAGSAVRAIAVAPGPTIWLSVPTLGALYHGAAGKVASFTRVSIAPVLANKGDILIGPLAVAGGTVPTIVAIAASAAGATPYAISAKLEAASLLTLLWKVSLPSTENVSAGVSIASASTASSSVVLITVGGTVFGVGAPAAD
jgi:hypothetical protein